MNRRKGLLVFVIALSAIGIGALTIAMLQSMKPTDAAKSDHILRVDITEIPLDSYREYQWYNHLIMVFRLGDKSAEYLIDSNSIANGPDYVKGELPAAFVYVPVSTYKGCKLLSSKEGDSLWPTYQGWYDPCHMGFWDFSGRNIPGVMTSGDAKLDDLTKLPNVKWINPTTIELRP